MNLGRALVHCDSTNAIASALSPSGPDLRLVVNDNNDILMEIHSL
jgi:hypothetical protein